MSDTPSTRPGNDFIRHIVAAHVSEGRYTEIVTRFPPEPNGYLHIGHAKSICLNFGIAREFGGRCHLRFDDTNPETEDMEFVEAAKRDIRWLGFDWGEHLYFASDYFERMYECAQVLIRKGLAYVDSQSEEEIREGRGTVTTPGVAGPHRDRSTEENLDLFERMRAGEFESGAHVLRAKIDLAATNMVMRDPVLYRIRHAHHYRRGNTWCIYPLYDYAHCLEDAFEGVSHSLCTLEFENNREIYDWLLDHVGFEEPRTHQYEFNRLNLEYTVVSKRKLIPLVKSGKVSGWDDPRMSTLAGVRRRGVPPEALRQFVDMVGVAKAESWVDPGKLEFAVRDVLNYHAPRVMAVLDPLRLVITNLDATAHEVLDAPYWPHDVPREGSRPVPFSCELWIERADFAEHPPKGFRRLTPGGEVRLRYGYVIRCDEVVKDAEGAVVEVRCTYDPQTRGGGGAPRKGIGTIHWVSASDALDAEVRLYDRLFMVPHPEDVPEGGDLNDNLNPASLVVMADAKVEPSVAGDAPDTRYQFERTGYFWRDPHDGVGDRLVFNRIVSLKDNWGKTLTASAAGQAGVSADVRVKKGPMPSQTPPPGAAPRVSEEREEARASDPDLAARMVRYQSDLDLTSEQADVLTGSREVADLFEAALAEHDDAGVVAGWVVNDLRGVLEGRTLADVPFDGAALGRLAALVAAGGVSRRAAKDVLAEMADRGGEPGEIVARLGLEKVSDGEVLRPIVDDVLAAWPEKVEEYRAGKSTLLGLFVGEVMKASKGAADPKRVRALIIDRLGTLL